MTQYFPFADKHLQDQESERDGEEIHILLIIFFENYGIEFLVIELADIVNDGIQSEFIVAGMHVRSVARLRDFFQCRLVQFRHDDIALGVFQQPAFHRNRLSLSGSHADSIYGNAHRSRRFRRFHRIVLMVLTISYDNDGAAVFALCAETLDTRVDGIADGSSLDRDGLRGNIAQEHLGGHIIGRDRQLDK